MTNFERQVVFSYEDLGLSVQQVASQFEEHLPGGEEDVLGILSAHSPKYIRLVGEKMKRLGNGQGQGLEEEDPELLELMSELRILARSSENDLVKARSLQFLINEKKGRNDVGVRGLALKERAQGLAEVDMAKRGAEFSDAMKKINQQIQDALGKRVIDLSSTETSLVKQIA